MTDEKKKELFPYFAYIYSQELNPEKYGKASSIDEWTTLIQDSQDDIDRITKAAEDLNDDDWDTLDKQYTEQVGTSESTQAQYAKKGTKLKNLKMAAKGIAFEKGTTKSYSRVEELKKGGKKKKCECGCEVVAKKFKGGQLVDSCGCCGKFHTEDATSFKNGGNLDTKKVIKKQTGGDSTSAQSQLGVAKKGMKVKPADRITKAQSGLKTKNVLPIVNGKKVPNDGADYSVQGPAPDSKMNVTKPTKVIKKPLVTPKKAVGGDLSKTTLKKDELRNAKIANPNPTEMQKSMSGNKDRIGKAKINAAKCGSKLKPKK